jgi:two-component system, NtrC family, response regulator HydG
MMKVLLEMWNYEVVLAGAADDGLHLAQSEPFDMYLLDTHLPDESAFELCEQICGVPGHAPVVFISTAPYEIDKQRGSQAGAIAYLTKLLDFDVLEITLTRLIAQALGRGLENTGVCPTV